MSVKEMKRHVLRACLILLAGVIVCIVYSSWVNGQKRYYDESNTIVYTGTLSHVNYDYKTRIRRVRYDYYTLCFADGQKFEILPGDTRELLDAANRTALRALPEGTTVTVIASQSYGNVCAFWTADQVFFSLDTYNLWKAKCIRLMYAMNIVFFAPFLIAAVAGYMHEFGELINYYRKKYRREKRKKIRLAAESTQQTDHNAGKK